MQIEILVSSQLPTPHYYPLCTCVQDGGDKETAASVVTPSEEVGEPAKDEFHVKTKAEKKKEKKVKKKQDAKSKGKAQQQEQQEEEQIQPQSQVTESAKPEAGQVGQEAAEKQGDTKEGDDEKTEDRKKKKKDKSTKDDKKGGAKVRAMCVCARACACHQGLVGCLQYQLKNGVVL